MMQPIDPERVQKSERNTHLTVISLVERFLLGVLYSINFINTWYYLKWNRRTQNPNLFFGLALTSSTVAGFLSLRIFKGFILLNQSPKILLFANSFITLGCLTSAVSVSPWYLVLGRFFYGSTYIASYFLSLLRSKQTIKEGSAMSCYQIMPYYFGISTGGIICILSSFASFQINKLEFHSTNFPFVIVALFFSMFQMIVVVFFTKIWTREGSDIIVVNQPIAIDNVSNEKRELDTVASTTSVPDDAIVDETAVPVNDGDPVYTEKKNVFKTSKLLSATASFLTSYISMSNLTWLPLIANEIMHWTNTVFSILVVMVGLLALVALVLINRKPKFTKKSLSNPFVKMGSLTSLNVVILLINFSKTAATLIVLWTLLVINLGIVFLLTVPELAGRAARAEDCQSFSWLGVILSVTLSPFTFYFIRLVTVIHIVLSIFVMLATSIQQRIHKSSETFTPMEISVMEKVLTRKYSSNSI